MLSVAFSGNWITDGFFSFIFFYFPIFLHSTYVTFDNWGERKVKVFFSFLTNLFLAQQYYRICKMPPSL